MRTTCPYCGVGCGVLATVNNSTGQVEIKGDPDHPANFGKLCSKGSNLAQTLGVERRLTQPYYQHKLQSMGLASSVLGNKASHNHQVSHDLQISHNIPSHQVSKNSENQRTDWDTVLDDVAARLKQTILEHGPQSVMFYVSGQLLTEDYYVANKLMKGFIGSNNIDSNSRLCMSSAVAGHKRAFGADLVPGSYTDFEDCDLLVLVGSNMAWCHPILFGRFLQAKRDNPHKKLVVIDPRRTDSCEFADLHLPLAPGSDSHLYNGLLKYLNDHGYKEVSYTSKCEGLEESLDSAEDWSLQAVATATELDIEQVEQFYQLVAAHNKTVTAFSMGVNQSSSGTDKVNAIINTHLLTGRIGKPGAGPFSLTGQPNAMGGREVGALSNLLAGHLQLENVQHRQATEQFWQSAQPIDANPGVTACAVADAILEGNIKALWIVATNPVVSLPEAEKFRQALAQCDLVIVSECSKDSDTLRCADIVLPAQSWGEKSGTVTNSERRISRQRGFLPSAGESKPDWWIFSQVAKRMGFGGFDYTDPSEIFLEHAALTSYQNDRYPRQLDLIAELQEQGQGYDEMDPMQWGGKYIDLIAPDFRHKAPQFLAIYPPKQAGMVNRFAVDQEVVSTKKSGFNNMSLDLAVTTNKQLSLRLITGRLRDQWHTMTRTALAAQLNQQQSVPTLSIHPADANLLGVIDKDFISIQAEGIATLDCNSFASKVMAQIEVSDEMRIGDAFMPMHWSDAFASLARVGTLIPTKVDPLSAQPELKNSAVTVEVLQVSLFGRILVHPDWLDSVLVQLRQMSGQISDSHTEQSAPPLIWSLSRQQDSILINLATCDKSVSKSWLTAKYWQQFIDSIVSDTSHSNKEDKEDKENREDKESSHKSYDIPLATSVMLNRTAQQLRYVVCQKSTLPTALLTERSSDQLKLVLYIAPRLEQLPNTHWLNSCFADMSEVASVKWLLAGRPATGYVDPGAIVCACMGVSENTIMDVITSKGAVDAIEVGKLCQAGTNCGSCVGQINELIKQFSPKKEVALA